jgi:hypothetical protein
VKSTTPQGLGSKKKRNPMEPASMVRRVRFPTEALDDISVLLRLTNQQFQTLDKLFSSGESAFPLRNPFVEKVASELSVSSDEAGSIVAVCHFLLRDDDALDDASFVDEMLVDLREFLEQNLPESERESLLDAFDANANNLKSLTIPKPEPLRFQKIRKLANGPESQLESVRTICQLRPLFCGPEDNETIDGLLPVTLMEIELEDSDGDSITIVFRVNNDGLDELMSVIERTRMKLDAIAGKYGSDLLSDEG